MTLSADPRTFYRSIPGTRLEPLGDMWAAYSPMSGETQLLNDESAAILEWLMGCGVGSGLQAADSLSVDTGLSAAELVPRIRLAWGPLAAAGLIEVSSSLPEDLRP